MPKEKSPRHSGRGVGADADRFAALAMHEEQILNDRVNIFLVAESILLVFAVEAGSKSSSLKLFAVLAGIAISICWCVTSWRQYLDLKFAVIALKREWIAFCQAYEPIPLWLKEISLLFMLVALPLIFIALWGAVYFYLPLPDPHLAVG